MVPGRKHQSEDVRHPAAIPTTELLSTLSPICIPPPYSCTRNCVQRSFENHFAALSSIKKSFQNEAFYSRAKHIKTPQQGEREGGSISLYPGHYTVINQGPATLMLCSKMKNNNSSVAFLTHFFTFHFH